MFRFRTSRGALAGQALLREPSPMVEGRGRWIDADVPIWIEIGDKVTADPQRSATDIEQLMARLHSMPEEVLDLYPPKLLPLTITAP